MTSIRTIAAATLMTMPAASAQAADMTDMLGKDLAQWNELGDADWSLQYAAGSIKFRNVQIRKL